MMLDTGASITILSKKFFETLDISLRKGTIHVKQKLVSATGDTADFLGKMKIKIHLGKNMYVHEVLIADIPSKGILGIDFLEQKMCDIILKEKCLRINGENVPFFKNKESDSWVGRITLFKDNETGTRSKNCDLPEHIRPVFETSIKELNEQQQIEFKNLLIKHKDLFSKSSADIGRTDLVDHTINTGDAPPIRQRPRRIPLAKMEAAEAEIERMDG
ncbi:unnamed protein product [Mytilus coruscus]|uniref:Peptidase A2 domain-containing protein n=1 Tax=Mytilus coruscus TaxID=42192 RepID=A0A6J8DP28_MYTCO|nr:unnamed protein product [Mytilus coruscus]